MASTAVTSVRSAKKKCPTCHERFDSGAFCPNDGARLEDEVLDSTAQDPYVGSLIHGDIEIRGIAGTGAMGRVYRAHQRGIERDVAVKILHRELSANAQLVARFNREAKIASKLSHPHVVEVFMVGQLPDGALYSVMEYLDGVSLAGLLESEGGSLPLERALAITMQICDAVGAGHARGIVHRDLKPENIMLVHRAEIAEFVKVLDFGIAKLTLGEQSMETQAGLIFGTARYISPEGAQGRQVGPPGDVYAIATMLYQMIAGRTPFQAEPLGLLVKHIHEKPPELRSLGGRAAQVPDAVARAIMDNLGKEPEQRAATGRALAAVLAAAARAANVSFAEAGVLARLSQLPAIPGEEHRGALDPTIDDAASMSTAALSPSPVVPMAPINASSGPIQIVTSVVPAPVESAPPSRVEVARSRTALWVFVSFVLGVALTAFAFHRFVLKPDREKTEFHARARLALAEGHYVSPPGGSVRDLVAQGLQRWPDDADLRQMKSAAEKEMITMAITARNSGDLVGARNLARDAFELEGTDNSARYMKAQTQEELDAAIAGTAPKTGAPRLIFESPPLVKPGERVQIDARIVWGGTNPHPAVKMKIALNPNGQTSGGTPISIASSDPNAIRAVFDAPKEVGSYDVAFEADVGGTVVRAMRDLDVAP